MNSCPYNFKTCIREDCDYWGEYGCGLFRGITSFDELEKRLQDLNDTDNLILKQFDDQRD